MKHRVGLVAATAGLLLAAGVVAVSTASAATAGCSATYTVASQWQGGFQGGVSLTNLGDPLTSWRLEFDFPGTGQAVSQGWNASWSQAGTHVTASNMSWNGTVATGGSVSVGFIGSWSGSNPSPTAFSVNGVRCTGNPATTAPTTPATSAPTTPPTTTPPTTTPTTPPTGGAAPALHVSGNKLLTSAGATYRLLGVNRSSAEFACVQGKGVWTARNPTRPPSTP